MKQTARIGILIGLSLQLACDPAFDYEPENWEPAGDYMWEHRSDQFDIQTHSLGGIVGAKNFGITLDVTNRADHPLVLEEAVLLAEDNKPHRAGLKGELKWRSSRASSTYFGNGTSKLQKSWASVPNSL